MTPVERNWQVLSSYYALLTPVVKASTKKTPQPIPESHSAIMKTQRQDHAFSEMERQASLREDVPVTRTLFTEDRSIDPPSARLLAVHRAIAHILHLSAAGDYIDHVLRDVDEFGIRADGSTDLSRLLKLRLGDAPGKGHVA
ncbi:unnamed protein product [Fusarium graminearum]|nr:unnamed protein product [Fusarium graminearum]